MFQKQQTLKMSQDVHKMPLEVHIKQESPSKSFVHWESLRNLKLIHLQVGQWKWIIRDHPDLLLGNNEPHYTLIILFHEQTQQYLCRVLGRTWKRGICSDFRDLYQLCEEFFSQRSCVGHVPITEDAFPLGCQFSDQCEVLIPGTSEDHPKNWICRACSKEIDDAPEDDHETSVKDEVSSDSDEKFIAESLNENDTNDVWKDEGWDEEDEAPLRRTRLQPKQVNRFFTLENTSRDWTCIICEEVLITSKRHLHLKTKHFVGHFSCSQCEMVFDMAKNLTDHVNARHGQDTLVRCPTCDKSFPANPSESGLESHYRVCIFEKREKPKSDLFRCEECGKNFKHRSAFKHHLNVHMPRRYKCQLCDYGAKTKGNLKLHQRVHQTGLECTCPLCGKSYKHKVSLQQHMNFMHSDTTTQLPCEKCGRQFSCKSSLQKHIFRAHSDLYKCPLCPYRGGGKHDLGVHVRTHEEPSIVCQTCGLKVKTKRILLKHLRVHTGETPFK